MKGFDLIDLIMWIISMCLSIIIKLLEIQSETSSKLLKQRFNDSTFRQRFTLNPAPLWLHLNPAQPLFQPSRTHKCGNIEQHLCQMGHWNVSSAKKSAFVFQMFHLTNNINLKILSPCCFCCFFWCFWSKIRNLNRLNCLNPDQIWEGR